MNSLRLRAALAALMTATSVVVWHPSGAQALESEGCTLQPRGHARSNEWLGCLRVNADLDTLPAVGDRATLTFEVTAQFERSNVTVEAALPSNLDWVSPPEGFETRDAHRAVGRISLAGTEMRRFAGT